MTSKLYQEASPPKKKPTLDLIAVGLSHNSASAKARMRGIHTRVGSSTCIVRVPQYGQMKWSIYLLEEGDESVLITISPNVSAKSLDPSSRVPPRCNPTGSPIAAVNVADANSSQHIHVCICRVMVPG